MLKLVAAAALGILLAESAAVAGRCKVQNAKPAGQWTFVQVYDTDTSHVVLRQAIDGVDTKNVTVSGHRVRVDHKLAGHRNYKQGTVAVCKDGNVIKF